MPQTLWSGSIVFGLVTIPVQLFSAIEDKSIHFHMVSSDGKCRLRRKLYCPETGKEYDFSETARGYEVAPGQYVIVDPEELEKLQPESGRHIEIQQFVDVKEIDPIHFEKPYYLVPKEEGLKPYKLLLHTLRESKRVAVAKFVMREHEYLAVLRPFEKLLVLDTLYYADEIRSADFETLNKDVKVDPRETKLALQLIDTLSGTFDPSAYHDEYRVKVEQMISELAKGRKIAHPAEQPVHEGKVINLLDALKKSISTKGKKQPEERKYHRKKTPPHHKKRAAG